MTTRQQRRPARSAQAASEQLLEEDIIPLEEFWNAMADAEAARNEELRAKRAGLKPRLAIRAH